jgi:DNA-binding PadR family transcriptional regulator
MKPFWHLFLSGRERLRAAVADAPDWAFFRSQCRSHKGFRRAYRDFMGKRCKPRGSGAWGPWEDWGPFSGFAGGPRGRFFEFGEVRLAILSLLKEGPRHGYQLIKDMTERSGGLYRASAGTVYPTLQQLEDERLVLSENQEGRRVYRLTPEGFAELEREKETVERIWKRAERWEDWGQWAGPESFTFFRPLGSLVKATFRAAKWAAGDSQRQQRLTEILEQAKRALDDLHRS